MSKARDLGDLLDTDGDVVSGSLDNVPTPSKTSIEALGIGVPAANLTGTVADARFPATLPASSGVNLTALNASNISSGTLPAGRYTDTVYTHPTTAGNKHVPSGGATDQVLTYSSSGTASWVDPAGGLEILASDPASPSIGDMWFNTGENKYKIKASGTVSPAWSTSTPGTAMKLQGGSGAHTAAWWTGGMTQQPGGSTNYSMHLFDGTAWSTGGALTNQQHQGPACCGSDTAAFMAGGGGSWSTAYYIHEYNGGTWSQVASSGGGMEQIGDNACGTQNAAVYVGGTDPGGSANNTTRMWNGSAESTGGTWNHSSTQHACMAGIQNAAISVMGHQYSGGPNHKSAETYNGSSWTTVTDPSMTAVQRARFGGVTYTTAHLFGGTTCSHDWKDTASGGGACQTAHESWNGSSWASQSVALTAREYGGAMTGNAGGSFGIASGGTTSGSTSNTELWLAGTGTYASSMSAE